MVIQKRFCQHFWISSINLFDDPRVPDQAFDQLLKRIRNIMQHPEWYIKTLKPRKRLHDEVYVNMEAKEGTREGYFELINEDDSLTTEETFF